MGNITPPTAPLLYLGSASDGCSSPEANLADTDLHHVCVDADTDDHNIFSTDRPLAAEHDVFGSLQH